MKYETAVITAQRMNVTVRAVQKWAKEGKIYGAFKSGRDWMIPIDAVRPGKTAEVSDTGVHKLSATPLPLILAHFTPGNATEYIEGIENRTERELAYSEYYYHTGQLKKATIAAEPYLDSKASPYRLSAAVLCVFSNLCREREHMTQYAATILYKELDSINNNEATDKLMAEGVLMASTVKTQLHLPFENIPPIQDYIKHLPGGHQMFANYLMAYKAYLEKDYGRSLGIIQSAVCCSLFPYPIAMIHLYILSAIDYMNLMMIDNAKEAIEKAWEIAKPDGFYMPFVEHYSLLQGLIETHFKKNHPDYYSKIITAVKDYNTAWYNIYNRRNKGSVSLELTPTEFTVAMLYTRNWRIKEIAAHMELSERTIMNYLQVIYEKLHINGKKELHKYILT